MIEDDIRASRPPGNIEAEHALLGAILYDNGSLDAVDGLIAPIAFLEPYHSRIFSHARELVQRGQLADPLTLADKLERDPAFEQTGGMRFLLDLVDRAPPAGHAPEYARLIHELWQRRALAAIGDLVGRMARGREGDIPAGKIVEEAEKELLGVQMTDRRVQLVSAREAVDAVIEELENPLAAPGVMTGIESLDEELGGLLPGELWLLAGRPAMGKSALAGAIALNVAMRGTHPSGSRLGAVEISGEMTVAQMMRRHITDHAFDMAGLDAPEYRNVRRRRLEDYEREAFLRAAHDLRELPTLYSVKRTGITIGTLRSLIRRQVAVWRREGIEPGLIIVDHVGLIRPDLEVRSRTEAQTEVAIRLKELADELGVVILALVQLNRSLEARDDKRPTLPDLRDAGAWEENADGVIGVYRDAYYATREQEPKKHDARIEWDARKESKIVEALLLKVREGSTGGVRLWADMGRNVIRSKQPETIFGYKPRQSGQAALDFASRPGASTTPPASPAAAPEPAPEPKSTTPPAADEGLPDMIDEGPPWDDDDGSEFA